MDQSGLFLQVNDTIRELATSGQGIESWGFICECPDVTCHSVVNLTLVEFDQRRTASPPVPIVARDHSA